MAFHVEGPTDPAAVRTTRVQAPRRSGEGDVIVQVLAAGVNRSDALACRGVIPGPFPRILGRDFAGLVVEGRDDLVGLRVWGSGGQEFGLGRDGTHAEYLTVPVEALVPMPACLSFEESAASALSFVTAAAAWDRAGGFAQASTAVVTGAAGGVGSAACQLARQHGLRVVGVVRSAHVAHARDLGYCDVLIRSDIDAVPDALRDAIEGPGAEVAVDTVGGALCVDVLQAMAVRGRVCIVSAPPSAPLAEVNLLDFYRHELSLTGLHTGRQTLLATSNYLARLREGFETHALLPEREFRVYTLRDAQRAYADLEAGTSHRPVLVPGTPPSAKGFQCA